MSELSVMVQASPMVRDRLGPALLHTYAAVKVFEGLDVDKENFDKYATRFEISQLLHRLWAREDCRSSILGQCGSKKFQVNSVYIVKHNRSQKHHKLRPIINKPCISQYTCCRIKVLWTLSVSVR